MSRRDTYSSADEHYPTYPGHTHFVYVIGAEELDCFKIGVAENPERRLRGMQTGNPYELSILEIAGPMSKDDAFALEIRLIETFGEERVRRNGEWFRIEPHDVKRVSGWKDFRYSLR